MRAVVDSGLRGYALVVAAAVLLASLFTAPLPAHALSPLSPDKQSQKQADQPRQAETVEAAEGTVLPPPGPAIDRTAQPSGSDRPQKDDAADKAEIISDMANLPEPVRRMRERIVEAAASGDVERLRPLFGAGANQTNVMGNEFEDPIEAIKSFSGDAEGQEILAILLDILSTGAAHLDKGTPDEAYVWPYFAAKPIRDLTPPERVDILRIVTAGDLAGMEEIGNYNFFRTGIGPDGKWKFLSGGD